MTNKTISLEHAGLNKRAINALNRAGITTLNELKVLPENDLYKVRDLGRQSFRAIRDAITEYLPNSDSEIIITRENAKQIFKGSVQLGTKLKYVEEMADLTNQTKTASHQTTVLINAVTCHLLQLTEEEIKEVIKSVGDQVNNAFDATERDLK